MRNHELTHLCNQLHEAVEVKVEQLLNQHLGRVGILIHNMERRILMAQSEGFVALEAEIAKVKAIVSGLRDQLAASAAVGMTPDEVKQAINDLDAAIAAPAVVAPVEATVATDSATTTA